jgi:gliding motility-associated-like protein
LTDSTDVNNPPVANNDVFSTTENTPITSDLLNNDFDVDSDTITINTTPLSNPLNGTVVINPDGTFTYTPDSGFIGMDAFTYQICDTLGLCDTALVTIDVIPNNPDNNAPDAVDDANVTTVNTPVSGNVLPNDTDPDNDPLTVTPATFNTPNGQVTVLPNGNYTYTPNPGYTGPDNFVYEVCDGGTPTLCDSATVYITVLPVDENKAPIAVNDINNTLAGVPVSGNVITNDIEPDGQPLTTIDTVLTQPDNGNVVIDSLGNYTYTPDPTFTGLDSFTYVVCDNQTPELCDTATVYITVIDISDPVNNPPVANNDFYVTQVDVPFIGDVINNDSDPDGDNIIVSPQPIVMPTNGTVTFMTGGMGMFTYTPNTGFSGLDTFYYRICDVATPSLCDTAMVVIEIVPDNNGGDNDPPYAGDDAYTTMVNVPVNGNVLSNDFDPNGDSLIVNPVVVSGPDSGTVVLNSDGTFIYTPNNNFFGPDQFVYEVCDDGVPSECTQATVYITVIPEAVTTIDTVVVYVPINTDSTLCLDASELPGNVVNVYNLNCATLTLGAAGNFNNGCFEYQAGPNVGSADTICAVIEDQFGNLDTTIYIVHVYDTVTPTIDTIPVSLLVNTTDTFCVPLDQIVGAPISIIDLGCQPTLNWGNIVGLTDSCFIYTAGSNAGGLDTVCIVVEDVLGNLDTTVFLITVIDPTTDTIPVTIYTNDDSTICVDDVYDLAGNIISVTNLNCSPIDNGVITNLGLDGCVDYQSGGVAGLDTLCLVHCDDQGFCDTTIIVINVIPRPDTLQVNVPFGTTDTTVCIPVSELPGTITSITVCDSTDNGTVAIVQTAGGQDTTCVTYTPDSLFIGNDTLCIVICDDLGNCDTTTIIYIVEPDCSNFGFLPDAVALDADNCVDGADICLPVPNSAFEHVVVSINGSVTPLDTCANANTTRIVIPVGNNMVVLTDTITGCADTSMVLVTCVSIDTIPDTLYTVDSLTLCPPANNLPGGPSSIVSISNICPGSANNGTIVFDPLDATCFTYVSDSVAGQDTACIVVCDALGNCDTTIYVITIVPRPDTVILNIPLGSSDTICLPLSELPGDVDDVFLGCGNPVHNMFTLNPPDTCVIITPLSIGNDTTCVIICDDQGFCDTTYFIIGVESSLEPPVAVNDTIEICSTGVIDVLLNDTISGGFDTLYILSSPFRGIASAVMGDSAISYEVVDVVPYLDSFTYVVCNSAGCDTATVIINAECSGPIKINNGMSPNGDNMNDTWVIEGIENYPDNTVSVFNRWGNLVYKQDGYLNDWDGKWMGDDLPDGTYFYYVRVNIDGTNQIFSGWLQIFR